MNFISKKYLLSALVICASFSSGFTSQENQYDEIFSRINDIDTLCKVKDRLIDTLYIDYDAEYERLDKQYDQCDNYEERSRICKQKTEAFNKKSTKWSQIQDAYWKARNNIGNKKSSIVDKITDVTNAMSEYKDPLHSFISKLSDYNKSNDEWLAECDEKVNSYNKNDNDIDRIINSVASSNAEILKRMYERYEAGNRRREQRSKESDRLFAESMRNLYAQMAADEREYNAKMQRLEEENKKQLQKQEKDFQRRLKEQDEEHKRNMEALETQFQNKNNFSISKSAQYSINNPISNFDASTLVSGVNSSNTYANTNNNKPLFSKPVVINKPVVNNEQITASLSNPVADSKPVEANYPANPVTNDEDAAQPITANVPEEKKPDVISDIENTDDAPAPVLDNKKNETSKPAEINKDEEANKPVNDEKVNKDKEESNNNKLNEFEKKFTNCKDGKNLRKVREQLKKNNDNERKEIYKKYEDEYNKISKYYTEEKEKCTNWNEKSKLIDKEMEEKDAARKNRDKLLQENSERGKKIEKMYNKAFEILFNKIYNDVLSKNIKDKSIIENLINNKETVFFHSLDPKDVQKLINLQKAAQEIIKNLKNKEALNAEKNNKFLEYVRTCNKEQLNNISMLYYQIYLILSGKINSEKKIYQTLDLFGLKNLLLYFNDITLADEDSYYNNLNNELIYAIINDYKDSNMSSDIYKKQLQNKKDIVLNKYIPPYEKRIKTIFDKISNKQTDIEEENKPLKMLHNITPEQWKEATEAADKYITAFDIFVNVVNQYIFNVVNKYK